MDQYTMITGGGVYECNDYEKDDLVRINVSGMIYETYRTTLDRFPSSLLGDEKRREKYFVKSKNEYFFDRHRACFESILYYYQSGGLLLRPYNVDMFLFAEEASFYGISGKNKALKFFLEEEDDRTDEHYSAQNHWQSNVWQLFENPASSLSAKILAFWSFLVIALSITIFCIETMPFFKEHNNNNNRNMTMNNNQQSNGSTANAGHIQVMFCIELGCVIWFSFEFVMRFISSPSKWSFIKCSMNIIDLVAIFPYFVFMIIKSDHFTSLSIVRIVRLTRVFRIFKLSRHSMGLKVLGQTLKASADELSNILFFVLIAVLLFSSGMYYAEHGENETFTSIPATFWFSLTTMKTLGYGDMIPRTVLGKIIAGLCGTSGLLFVAIPIPIIVSNFKLIYKKDDANYRKRATASLVRGGPSRIVINEVTKKVIV